MGNESKIPGWARPPRRPGFFSLVITTDDGRISLGIDERAGYLIGRSRKVIPHTIFRDLVISLFGHL
jgi:hypothetical protein